MSHFLVNGVECTCPVSTERPFGELMDYVHRTLNHDASLVSIIRVNGEDMSEREESALSSTPISSIDSVEVLTVHPRELAEETLQTLIPFTTHLEGLSRQAAERLQEAKNGSGAEPSSPLTRLIDGLATFSEAIGSVKEIFGIGPEVEAAHALEMTMLEKLRETPECQQAKDYPRMREMLAADFPALLTAWREQGIPALIRSRDS